MKHLKKHIKDPELIMWQQSTLLVKWEYLAKIWWCKSSRIQLLVRRSVESSIYFWCWVLDIFWTVWHTEELSVFPVDSRGRTSQSLYNTGVHWKLSFHYNPVTTKLVPWLMQPSGQSWYLLVAIWNLSFSKISIEFQKWVVLVNPMP